jgi:hypothetical protein
MCDRGRSDRCVLYDPIADHLNDSGSDRDGIRGNLGDFPSQLRDPRQIFNGLVRADRV